MLTDNAVSKLSLNVDFVDLGEKFGLFHDSRRVMVMCTETQRSTSTAPYGRDEQLL